MKKSPVITAALFSAEGVAAAIMIFCGKYAFNEDSLYFVITAFLVVPYVSAAASFVSSVDSADVFVNASTRFADGYRFGKGAEVGISTNKIHSRGPVGMEGLMIYKYVLIGEGNIVADYAGKGARRFTHRDLDRELDL